MAGRRLSKQTLEFIAHYEERMLEFAGASAVYGHADPETALWNARRAVEAICLIALCAQRDEAVRNVRGDKYGPKGLDKLLGEVDGIVDPHRTTFENLQRLTNLGVHVRHEGRVALRSTVDQVHEGLRQALAWTYGVGPAASVLAQQSRMVAIVEQLRLATEGQLTPHLQIAEAERLLKEISGEREATLKQIATAQARAVAAEARLAKLEAERGKFKDTARRLWRARWWSRVYAAGGVAAGLTAGLTSGWCVGAMAGFFAPSPVSVMSPVAVVGGVGAGQVERVEPEVEVVPLGGAAVVDAGATGLDGGAAVVDGGVAFALAAVVDRAATGAHGALEHAPCPEGRVRVKGDVLQIVQPERRYWPGYGKGALPPIVVEAFCLDARPARWLDVPGDVRAARRACTGRATAIACALTRDEAEAACRARGARLPSVGEWEVAVRSGAALDTNPKGSEWVRDRAPPTVLGFRGAPLHGDGLYRAEDLGAKVGGGEARWSWNQEPKDPRYPKVGFRCVGEG